MGEDFDQRSYADAGSLFTEGKAAVYPAGSWDIMTFKGNVNMGVFPPLSKRKVMPAISPITPTWAWVSTHIPKTQKQPICS
nr:hypothetical protein [Enterovibrio nigricans]